MREAFRRDIKDIRQRAIVSAADRAFAHSLESNPWSYAQLYTELADRRVIKPSRMSPAAFQKLLRTGQWAGRLDWDVRPNHPALPVHNFGSRPVEIWCRNYWLLPWFVQLARDNDLTLVYDFKPFTMQALWHGIDRLDKRLEVGQRANILYVSEPMAKAEKHCDHIRQRVGHALAIRASRRAFNREMGQLCWTHSQFMIPPAKQYPEEHAKVRPRLDQAITEAEKIVASGFRICRIADLIKQHYRGKKLVSVNPHTLQNDILECVKILEEGS